MNKERPEVCRRGYDFDLAIIGTRGIPNRYGGFEELAEVLAEYLPRLGVECSVSSSESSVVSKLPDRIKRIVATPLGTALAIAQLRNQLPRHILVVNPINVFVAIWLSIRGHLVVLHMDGRDDLRQKWNLLFRWIIRVCQFISIRSKLPLVFDSARVREELDPNHRASGYQISYGGCRACAETRRYWKLPKSGSEFMSLARLEPENQLVIIADAFRRSAVAAELSIVTKTYPSEYTEGLRNAVLRDTRIKVIDGIWNKSKLCSMYLQASAVIHGHSIGGTNPSLVLALCHGTPVLAHDNPYNREVAGSLARYWKDEQELTKLLDDFDPATWPYDQAAVDDFNRRYNWDDVVEKYKRVLGLDQSSSGGQSNGQ